MAIKLKPYAHYQARSQIAKALAHPSRLLILDALAEGEQCVCRLTELVGADQSTVSKHLGILRQAGLVDYHRKGAQVFYKLKVCCLQGFWECIESVLKENIKSQSEALNP